MAVIEYGKNPVDLTKGIYDYWGTGSPVTALANAANGSLFRQTDATIAALWEKSGGGWARVAVWDMANAFTGVQEFASPNSDIASTGAAIVLRERNRLGYPTDDLWTTHWILLVGADFISAQ